MKYNIIQHFNISSLLLGLFLSVLQAASGQSLTLSRYGAAYVPTKKIYQQILLGDSNQKMVSLRHFLPGVGIELRYAEADNFMGRILYVGRPGDSFLRLPVAKALAAVQRELNSRGLGLKIWDAYRPYSVTVSLWEKVRDDRYAADPAQGSGHNRGIAVDLTLVDLQSGKELPMPTGFDNFTDTAHADFMELPAVVLQNRKMLADVMERNGFLPLRTEWWHYSWPRPERWALLDLSFSELSGESVAPAVKDRPVPGQ
jgi:zinc D-Ala-D-Ala dipeptidase